MKKLLSVLSSVVLVGTSVSGVIACNSEEKEKERVQRKNQSGDSTWAWIPGIYGGKNITSPDVWNVLTTPFTDVGTGTWSNDPMQWDGATRMKMSIQLAQILSVAVLANPEKFFDGVTTPVTIADYSNLKDILTDQWKLLVQNTNNIVQKKIDGFKASDKKNWEKKYREFLDNTYPDNSGATGSEKYRIEEQKYKAAIMTTGADGGTSATQMLTNLLLNNNMRSYQSNTPESAGRLLNDFNTFIQTPTNNAIDWNKGNQNVRTQLALAFSWDATAQSFGAELTGLSIAEINTRIDKIKADLQTANFNLSAFLQLYPPVATPVFTESSDIHIGKPQLTQTYDSGQFSVFQKYMTEKWFQNEKPLAISKMTYAFKTGATPTETGFKKDTFDETTQQKIIDDLIALNAATNWDGFLNVAKGTATHSTDLLTLSSSGDAIKSNILKASVYEQLSNNQVAIPDPTDLDVTFNAIDRQNTPDPISKKWPIGGNILGQDYVIAFFDTDGFNLVHVDGNEYLLDTDANSYTNLTNDWQFRSLNYSKNYFANLTDKSNIMTTTKANQKINTQYSNAQYLWYLTNRSLVNQQSDSKTKFNVTKEITSYASLSASSTGTDNKWWFWIYDFFNNFSKNILQGGSPNWLENFITFKNTDGTAAKPDWFLNIINAMASNLSGGSVQRLYASFETENKTIQTYKPGAPSAEIKTAPIIAALNGFKYWDEQITTLFYTPQNQKFIATLSNSKINIKQKFYNTGDYDWFKNYYTEGEI